MWLKLNTGERGRDLFVVWTGLWIWTVSVWWCLWPRSSAFWSGPYRAVLSRTVPGWFPLRAFKRSCGKWTKADHHGTLCTWLLCATHCIPMGYGVGLRSGAHRGTVWLALACSGPHQEVIHCGMLPDQFGTVTVHIRSVQASLWRGTVRIWHGYSVL